MAITITETAKNNAWFAFLGDIDNDPGFVVTFNVYAGATLKDTFDKPYNYLTYSSGQLYYDTSLYGNLVFTIPPSTTGINKIELVGTFPVVGEQPIATWYLTTGLNYPSGGTLSLSQFVLSMIADA